MATSTPSAPTTARPIPPTPSVDTTSIDRKQVKSDKNQAKQDFFNLFSKIIGGAKYESGAAVVNGQNPGDNSTVISDHKYGDRTGLKGFFNILGNSEIITGAKKLFTGARATFDMGSPAEKKAQLNVKMMDYELYRKLDSLYKSMFDSDGNAVVGDAEVDRLRSEIMNDVGEIIKNSQMLDSEEKVSLVNILGVALNSGNSSLKDYIKNAGDINNETKDEQHLKAFDDATHRGRATLINMAAAAGAKSLAIAAAPLTGFLGAVGIAGVLETAVQRQTKIKMEENTLNNTIKNINDAVNKELAHFFVTDSGLEANRKVNRKQENAENPPLKQYDINLQTYQNTILALQDGINNALPVDQMNGLKNQLVIAANNLIKISYYINNNFEILRNRIVKEGAKLSAADYKRFQDLKNKVIEIKTTLVKSTLAADPQMRLSYVKDLKPDGTFDFGESIETSNSADSGIVKSDAMSRIAAYEATNLETYRVDQMRAVRETANKQLLGKFALNSLGSAFAIFGAAAGAAGASDAFRGEQMIGVTKDAVGNNWMELNHYVKDRATSTFAQKGGFGSNFGLSGMGGIGDAMSSGFGEMFSRLTVLTNKMQLGSSFMDQWKSGSDVGQAFGEVKPNAGLLDMVNPYDKAGNGYDLVRGFDFGNANDFGFGGGPFVGASRIPMFASLGLATGTSLWSISKAAQTDQTYVNYALEKGLHSPKMTSKLPEMPIRQPLQKTSIPIDDLEQVEDEEPEPKEENYKDFKRAQPLLPAGKDELEPKALKPTESKESNPNFKKAQPILPPGDEKQIKKETLQIEPGDDLDDAGRATLDIDQITGSKDRLKLNPKADTRRLPSQDQNPQKPSNQNIEAQSSSIIVPPSNDKKATSVPKVLPQSTLDIDPSVSSSFRKATAEFDGKNDSLVLPSAEMNIDQSESQLVKRINQAAIVLRKKLNPDSLRSNTNPNKVDIKKAEELLSKIIKQSSENRLVFDVVKNALVRFNAALETRPDMSLEQQVVTLQMITLDTLKLNWTGEYKKLNAGLPLLNPIKSTDQLSSANSTILGESYDTFSKVEATNSLFQDFKKKEFKENKFRTEFDAFSRVKQIIINIQNPNQTEIEKLVAQMMNEKLKALNIDLSKNPTLTPSQQNRIGRMYVEFLNQDKIN